MHCWLRGVTGEALGFGLECGLDLIEVDDHEYEAWFSCLGWIYPIVVVDKLES